MKHIHVVALSLSIMLSLCLTVQAQVSEMESNYLRLASRFDQRDMTVQKDLQTYLKEYAYTTYEDECRFMLGAIMVEKGYFKRALKDLEAVDYKRLSRAHQPQYQFYRGYTYLQMEDYKRAAGYFQYVRVSKSEYVERELRLRSSYYYAFCLYQIGNYEKAMPVLAALENEPAYSKTVPYYLTQIYYAKQEYDSVSVRAQALLDAEPNAENAGELHRMLGEMKYREGDYKGAVEHLRSYTSWAKNLQKELVRNDCYMLGMAEYKTGAYESAVSTLKQVKQQKDTISESTCLTLGNAYVKLGQLDKAKISYQAAIQFALTPQNREEAMYNYALCSYQSSTALGEGITAFTDFLREYPKSKHQSEVYSLMCDAFMRSKNYPRALAALDSIPNPNAQMKKTKQYLRYQMGTDAFIQGKMADACRWLTETIDHAEAGDTYRTDAYYWRAEAEYRLKDFDATAADIAAFYQQPDARRSPNHLAAAYLTGYTKFGQKDYDAAKGSFLRYIDQTQETDPTHADALNRVGDCLFNARDFEGAINYYGQVISLNATGSDYATFQRGYAQGLLHDYTAKISSMNQLVSRYPRSDYADDGLYEIARSEIQLENETAAIEAYDLLLASYPHSNKSRKACLERAMLYRNQKQYDQAIEAYKKTITSYPGSEEAYTALEQMEAVYVETNRIAEYLKYTKQLGKLNMSITTKDDSLSYAAAELQYMLGNYREAVASLSTYLSQYCPGGRYCTTAQYYTADSHYRLGQMTEALAEYKSLADIVGNPYMQEACTRAAELSYDQHDYQGAQDYFRRMLEIADKRSEVDVAQLGVLRCSYYLGDWASTIEIANRILSDEMAESSVKDEALYNRAKAYVGSEQYGKALIDLTQLAEEVRTAQGAESKYRIAECYYKMGNRDQAEQEIMAFAQMQTQQQYWLARALVLLSDINVDRGEDFQAQQYLLTLEQNYRGDDDIAAMVATRLEAVNNRLNVPEPEPVVEEAPADTTQYESYLNELAEEIEL